MKTPEKSADRVDSSSSESSPAPPVKPERPERASVTPPAPKSRAGSSADIPEKKQNEAEKVQMREASKSPSVDRSSDVMSESTTSNQSEGGIYLQTVTIASFVPVDGHAVILILESAAPVPAPKKKVGGMGLPGGILAEMQARKSLTVCLPSRHHVH